MRPTLLFTLAATLTGMVSAQYGAELYARDVDGSDAWAGLVRRAAEPEPFALHAAVDDLLEENPHLVRRMSDVFRAAVNKFDNYHRKREGRMSTAEERECEQACKDTYNNQIRHAKKLKIDTKKIESDYAECKKWCQTH